MPHLQSNYTRCLFQDPQGAKYLRLLTIFAFGVYDDYLSAREELPLLDEAATKKLRLLTLASMASKEKLIAYGDLQKSLHIDSVRMLEDLIIEGASQNVVQGKLDQKNRRFEVEYAMARDIQKVETRTSSAPMCSRNVIYVLKISPFIRRLRSLTSSRRWRSGTHHATVCYSRWNLRWHGRTRPRLRIRNIGPK